jgi:hypothetical protein
MPRTRACISGAHPPLLPPVEPRRRARAVHEAVTDDLLLERLSALGRLIDPTPWVVTAEAKAVFAGSAGLEALLQQPDLGSPADGG